MGRHSRPRRSFPAVPVVGSSAGALTVAAVVALVQTAVASPSGPQTASESRPVASVVHESDEWFVAAGPLAIPTIGVVAPGMENWSAASPALAPLLLSASPLVPNDLLATSATPFLPAFQPPAPPAVAVRQLVAAVRAVISPNVERPTVATPRSPSVTASPTGPTPPTPGPVSGPVTPTPTTPTPTTPPPGPVTPTPTDPTPTDPTPTEPTPTDPTPTDPTPTDPTPADPTPTTPEPTTPEPTTPPPPPDPTLPVPCEGDVPTGDPATPPVPGQPECTAVTTPPTPETPTPTP
jgi:hypothetical protein